MSAKHTPGDWVVDRVAPGDKEIVISPIGCVISIDDCTAEEFEEAMANAELLAAAPKLLESLDMTADLLPALCKQFEIEDDFTLQVFEKETGNMRLMLFSEVIEKATRALARATGQEVQS